MNHQKNVRIQIAYGTVGTGTVKSRETSYFKGMLVEAHGVENTARCPDVHTVRHGEVGPSI